MTIDEKLAGRNLSSSGRQYWDYLAADYDALYQTRWSELENEWVSHHLARTWQRSKDPVHVDLGAGTGLGQRLAPEASYVAIDLSAEMLAQNPNRPPSIQTDLGSGIPLADACADVVSAFFAAFSYVPNSEQLVGEIARVLRPGGVAYLSVLSRWSFRRMRSRQFNQVEFYETRNSSASVTPPLVRTFRVPEMKRLIRNAGMEVNEYRGLGVFSGAFERDFLFPPSQMIARLLPSSSHLLEFTARKRPMESKR